jgi:hypothetical protein
MSVVAREGNVVITDRLIITGCVTIKQDYKCDKKEVIYNKEGDFYYTSVYNNSIDLCDESISILMSAAKHIKECKGTLSDIPYPGHIETLKDNHPLWGYLYFFRDVTLIAESTEFVVKHSSRYYSKGVTGATPAFLDEYFPNITALERHKKEVSYTMYASNGEEEFGDVTILEFRGE